MVLGPGSVVRLTITVNMASTKYKVNKFNGIQFLSLAKKDENLLIQQGVYKALLER